MTLIHKFSAVALVIILAAYGLIMAFAEPKQADAPAPAEAPAAN